MATARRFRTGDEARAFMGRLGVHSKGADIMAAKAMHLCVALRDVEGRCANIVKQEALAAGAEAAVPWQALTGKDCGTVLLMGTVQQLGRVCEKLRVQPFSLGERADEIDAAIENYLFEGVRLPRLKGKRLKGSAPLIMGVVNATPDSFYDGGRHGGAKDAIAHARKLISDGADVIDIGGESTRPGARPVPLKEELKRAIPVVEALRGAVVSIDTMKPQIAERAIEAGASIINDVTALSDPKMARVAAKAGAGVVLMHMQGEPRTMQDNPKYDDVVGEIAQYLAERADAAISAGVRRERVAIDPGIGFGKTTEHNLEILSRLRELRSLGYPVCVGVSRKAFIGKTLDLPPEERLEGTLGAVAVAVMNGADILRVHDVRECRRAMLVAHAIHSGKL
ncbi:MAG: dihydropteroate synthase [Euryarchaeota archaeon]|nr:dihydropteroate synthase [Euryarchaeota archaeon]